MKQQQIKDLYKTYSLYTVDQLKNLQRSLEDNKSPKKKGELLDALVSIAKSKNKLQAVWSRLNDLEKLALQEGLYNDNGIFNEWRIKTKYGEAPKMGSRYSWNRNHKQKESLKLSFFFIPTQDLGRSVRAIPDSMQKQLKTFVPKLAEDHPNSLSELPDKLPDQAQTITREQVAFTELQDMQSLLLKKQLKVSEKTKVPSKSLLNKLAKSLGEYYRQDLSEDAPGIEHIKSFGWLQLLRSSCFVKCTKGDLKPSKIDMIGSQNGLADIIKQIWQSWVFADDIDEFSRINHIKGQKSKGSRYFTSPSLRKLIIQNALKSLELGKWLSFDDFSKHMIIKNNVFEVTSEPGYLYLIDREYGAFYNFNWQAIEESYIRCVLVEYAATLGLIDIVLQSPISALDHYRDNWGADELMCLSRYDGLLYIRLTDLGDFVLNKTQTYIALENNEFTTLSVQKEGYIQFAKQPSFAEKQLLNTYANEEKGNLWHLSQEKISIALESQDNLSELSEFISERDEQPFLPQDCERLFKNSEKNKKSLKFNKNVSLFNCKNKTIRDTLLNDKNLKKHCQAVGDSQIIVSANKQDLLIDTARQLGFGLA